jgi:hypothetical protein
MEKICLIFIISSQEIEKLKSIKEEIIKYLGIRMIADTGEDFPVLNINSKLTPEDETKICNIVETSSKTGVVIITDKIDNIGSSIIEHI